MRGDGDADARHRRGQHRPVGDRDHLDTGLSGLQWVVDALFRQAGIAVGVAALGALIPAAAAFGDGSPQAYVDGFHDALWVGAVLSMAAGVSTALLLRGHGRDMPRDVAVETA